MTNLEFSNEFDALLNSHSLQNTTITVDEYEKSLFLTRAQEEIILGYYNGLNTLREPFESSEENRRYLHDLIVIDSFSDLESNSIQNYYVTSITLPDDVWFILKEGVIIGNKEQEVIPTTHDDYYKTLKNPFKGPLGNRVLRVEVSDKNIELTSYESIDEYSLTYLKKLTPIVLIDLPEGLSIQGASKETTCKLNSVLHSKILTRAVELAFAVKANNLKTN